MQMLKGCEIIERGGTLFWYNINQGGVARSLNKKEIAEYNVEQAPKPVVPVPTPTPTPVLGPLE